MKVSHKWFYCFSDQPEVKSNIVQSGPVGYYYKDVWQSISGPTVRQFNTPSVINQCLKGKMVHLYGDSTVRQWFEYLNQALPGSNEQKSLAKL